MKYFLPLLLCFPVFSQFQGTVIDRATSQPVAGAIVRIQKAETFTTTDASGFFQLNDTADYPFYLTAAANHYFVGSLFLSAAPGGNVTIEVDAVSLEVIDDHPVNGPQTCGGCHGDQVLQWEQSPMAKTGLNRWVFDLYNGEGTAGGMNGFVYQRDSVHRFKNPNSDCSACHSPIHWLTDIENAGMGDINQPNLDMENGVQCEVCHRAYDVADDKLNFPGVDPAAFTLLRGPQRVEFGLLGDSVYEGGIMRAAYNPQLSAQLCASCHEDNLDHDDDGDFEDAGSIPHETTFSEWETYRQLVGPDNAQTCIDCHMPATDADQFCIVEGGRQVGTIRDHNIRGTSAEYLENAVTMTSETAYDFEAVQVDVTIDNQVTGHAVPTGIMIRNMILLVTVTDQGGTPLAFLEGDQVDDIGGIGDPAQGYYAGQPGKAFYRSFTDGVNDAVFYTEAIAPAFDSRIMPGDAYVGSFRFSLNDMLPEHVDVDVRLIYRRAYRELIDTKGWTEMGNGGTLEDIQAPHYGHLMERNEATSTLFTSTNVLQNLALLAQSWLQPSPYRSDLDSLTNIRHMITFINASQ